VQSPELLWDGQLDSGDRVAELTADLASCEPPLGVSASASRTHAFVEIATRSNWAFVTWAVSAVMLWLGRTTDNWFLLVLFPFMAGAAIMQTWGRVCIVVKDGQVSVFEGIGGVGRRHDIPLRAIERVEYAVKRGRGGSTAWIVLNLVLDGAGRQVKFGRHLNEAQIRFVIAFLLDATQSFAV
jgi:hypothetical protein